MPQRWESRSEWLEANGLGGFASGTVSGRRTRRYHALLLPSTSTGRFVLVNGFDAWVETARGVFPISSQVYFPGVMHPDGASRLISFQTDPWPQWTIELPGGTRLEQQLFVPHLSNEVAVSWRVVGGPRDVQLVVRPFISGRDCHSLMHENESFCFDSLVDDQSVSWRPYAELPSIHVQSNARYVHEPLWYRDFWYSEESERGLDCREDLASPGVFHWDLSQDTAVWLAVAHTGEQVATIGESSALVRYHELREAERRRRLIFPEPLARAADAYIVCRGNRKTIIAGYPWFADWGRDTFIAMRGLCLATGRLADAEEILVSWSQHVSDGMLPNRFPDHDGPPEYNSVDASLWYVIAVSDFLRLAHAHGHRVPDEQVRQLEQSIEAILTGYAAGTRYGIRADDDGLLAAGEPGVQLTWMDAKVGDWVVTPRIGKPVEIQSLWLNALRIGGQWSNTWRQLYDRGLSSFREKFWNDDAGCLYDVVDVDHRRGQVDDSIRPNQIFAVGGLSIALIDGEKAESIVAVVEERLWTPLGLRTLAADDPRYIPRYQGGVLERDDAYHQGTVWPWLLGPFVEAWIRVRGGSARAKCEASKRFIPPLASHWEDAGLGHISEIADGDAPHAPRGCPFQAWSVGEFIRLTRVVVGSDSASSSENTPSRNENSVTAADPSSIGDSPAPLQASIYDRIDKRTHGKLRELQLEFSDGQLIIRGTAPSFHIRQLAEVAAREVAAEHGALIIASQVEVAAHNSEFFTRNNFAS